MGCESSWIAQSYTNCFMKEISTIEKQRFKTFLESHAFLLHHFKIVLDKFTKEPFEDTLSYIYTHF